MNTKGHDSDSHSSSGKNDAVEKKKKLSTHTHKLPVWMTKQLKRKSTESSISSLESDEPEVAFKCTKTVYVMTEKELKEMAFQVLTQAGKKFQGDAAQKDNNDELPQ